MPIREQFSDDASFQQALRDWFAGQALAGMGEGQPFAYHDANVPMAKAQYACAIADAMLEARKRKE